MLDSVAYVLYNPAPPNTIVCYYFIEPIMSSKVAIDNK
jgi:hypothetical protein